MPLASYSSACKQRHLTPTRPCCACVLWLLSAGVAYTLAFTLLMNYFSYLALKYYSGQQPRASVSCSADSSP